MEEIQTFAATAIYFLVLLLMIHIWYRVAGFIGELLGIRRFIEWLIEKVRRFKSNKGPMQ